MSRDVAVVRRRTKSKPNRWPFRTSMYQSSLLENRLDVDLDLDRVAHQPSAGLERHIPAQSPVLAVDGGRGAEAGDLVAHDVLPAAEKLRVQDDLARHSPDCQLADDASVAGIGRLDP